MITVETTIDFAKWYVKVEDDRPKCISCDLYLVRYEGTSEVFEDGIEAGIMCRHCSNQCRHQRYEDLEELRQDTKGEERCSAIENAIASERADRAKEFRSERAKKAASTRAKKAESRSGSGDERGNNKSRSKPRIRWPKNT